MAMKSLVTIELSNESEDSDVDIFIDVFKLKYDDFVNIVNTHTHWYKHFI